MASSLLFNWIAQYMYEGDAPLAERRAAALALDRDLLRELLGAEELRELLDPGVLADVELELQCLADGRRARSADELHDVLRKVGDLTAAEIDVRCEGEWRRLADGARSTSGGRSRSASATMSGSRPPKTPPAIATRSGVRSRSGCRWRSPTRSPRPLEELVGRFARTHGPFLAVDVARRFSAPVERIEGAISALAAEERLVLGEFRPDGVQREWCDVNVLRQLRRRSLAVLRKEVEPVEQDAFARFLPAWHSIPAERRGLEALVDSIGMLAGAPIVASTLDRDVLPSRSIGYRPAALDELCTSGEVVWTGAGAIGARDGRIRLCFADQIGLLAPGWETGDEADGEIHVALRRLLVRTRSELLGAVPRGSPRGHRHRAARRPVGSRVGRRGHQRHPGAVARRCSPAAASRVRNARRADPAVGPVPVD